MRRTSGRRKRGWRSELRGGLDCKGEDGRGGGNGGQGEGRGEW